MKRTLLLFLLSASCASRATAPAAAAKAPADGVSTAASGPLASCKTQPGQEEMLLHCDALVVHYSESTVVEGVPLERVAVKNVSDLQKQSPASKIAVFPRSLKTAGGHEYYAQWVLVNDPKGGEFRIYQGLARLDAVRARVLNCTGARDDAAYRRCEELCDLLAANGPPSH